MKADTSPQGLHLARQGRLNIEQHVDAGDPLAARGACLVIPMFETRRLHDLGKALDKASQGHIRDALRRTGKRGRRGESLMLLDVPGTDVERVLLIGCGRRRGIDARRFRKIADHAARLVLGCGATEIRHCLSLVKVERRDTHWRVRQLSEAMARARYRFEYLKGGEEQASEPADAISVCFAVSSESRCASANRTLLEARAISSGVALARDLGNLPPNLCTPGRLVDEAVALAERHASLSCEILDEPALNDRGMGALLSVAAGSNEPARLIVVRHHGAGEGEAAGSAGAASKPIVLLGKGITFDSGGLSIKPSASMENMKYDLCGAATVLGAIEACAMLDLPEDVVVVVAAAENMPGRGATRPGDVITTLSGRTVEVLNTDAEGRLALCDGITYCKRELNPQVIIDVATLTGAVVTALGRVHHGLFSNSRSLSRRLVRAGERADDPAWPMPASTEYQSLLDSRVADMRNIGGSAAGAVTAACFLARFAEGVTWAHLDIAGTATDSGGRSANGRPVGLLVQYLLDRARTL